MEDTHLSARTQAPVSPLRVGWLVGTLSGGFPSSRGPICGHFGVICGAVQAAPSKNRLKESGVESVAASVFPILCNVALGDQLAGRESGFSRSPSLPGSAGGGGGQSSPFRPSCWRFSILPGNPLPWDCVCHRVTPGSGDSLS